MYLNVHSFSTYIIDNLFSLIFFSKHVRMFFFSIFMIKLIASIFLYISFRLFSSENYWHINTCPESAWHNDCFSSLKKIQVSEEKNDWAVFTCEKWPFIQVGSPSQTLNSLIIIENVPVDIFNFCLIFFALVSYDIKSLKKRFGQLSVVVRISLSD